MSVSPLEGVLAALGILAGSGVIALAMARASSRAASLAGVAGAVAGCALGLWAALRGLAGGVHEQAGLAWSVPGGAALAGLDPLSAFFLPPLFVLGALCAVYGRRYLAGHAHGAPLGLAAGGFNLLLAAMTLVLVARHAMLFLVAWEVMTLLAYLLVTFDHAGAEVRRAGWVYLIASHVATIALIAMFLVLGARAGGALDFVSLGAAGRLAPGAAGAAGVCALLLALAGFGLKAGVVGLHVWLPEAHAAAPSHVSAIMSGVLIKLGVYGLLRITLLVPPPGWFGLVVAALGLLGALTGISLALYQRDLKRVLAYSSVENVGIVLAAVGLGLWAHARGDATLATLAYAGGLLHVWNHAAMKGLMFLGAGNVLHATGSKDLERTGGLLRRMPWTGAAWIFGAIAIAALPPLNGFVGEWLLYRALASVGLGSQPILALAAIAGIGVLALAGGLAALCFLRLTGVALLGEPRARAAAEAHEPPRAMLAPLAVLGAVCVAAALLPAHALRLARALFGELAGGGDAGLARATASLAPLVKANLALLGGLAVAFALVAWRVRRRSTTGTWDCGYAGPTARMQYTGRSFSELVVERLVPRWLRLRQNVRRPEGTFPAAAAYSSDAGDPLTRGAYEPFLTRWGDRFARLRWLQQGSLHTYLVYIVVVTVLGLAWVSVRGWWLR